MNIMYSFKVFYDMGVGGGAVVASPSNGTLDVIYLEANSFVRGRRVHSDLVSLGIKNLTCTL